MLKHHTIKTLFNNKLIILLSLVTILALAVLLLPGLSKKSHFTAQVEAAIACPTTAPTGTSTLTANVAATGDYSIWSRMQIPVSNNSFYLKIDATCYKIIGTSLPIGQWGWVNFENGTTAIRPNLAAGNHTITIIGNETGVKVDRLILNTSQTCVPTGKGDNCSSDTDDLPTATIALPANNETVNGSSVLLNAIANDDKGVVKVELLVDGALVGVDTTSPNPYSYSWNSTGVTNGSHAVQAKVTDTKGQVGSSATINVNVQNDTTAPTAPVLTATATAPNTVALSWSASTDANGIANYFIVRGGVTLTQVGPSTLTYTDTTTSGSTTYSYYIIAKDTIGNPTSSNPTTVTTPAAPDTTKPSTPTNLAGSAVSSTQINLTWTASTDNIDVAGYDVYRGGSKVATVTTLSFGDAGLTAGSAYSYYVIAKDAAGNPSPQSATITVATPQPPQAIGNLQGRVTNAKTGKRISGVKVVLTYPNGANVTATTNTQGWYYMPNLTAGTHNAVFSKTSTSYVAQTVSVTINANLTTTKNISLSSIVVPSGGKK